MEEKEVREMEEKGEYFEKDGVCYVPVGGCPDCGEWRGKRPCCWCCGYLCDPAIDDSGEKV